MESRKPAGWSDAEATKWLSEVMDPQKVHLICSSFPNGKAHAPYSASSTPPPPRGCVNCWKAYWWFVMATTPPHNRQMRLEAAYRAVYDGVKSYERGEFDFEPLDRAIIETTKDGFDDKTQTYRDEK